MNEEIDKILDGLIAREGGYVNNPADPGGPTKYGVTIGTLERWLGRPVTESDVKALTEDEARHILLHEYIDAPGFSALIWHHPLLEAVADASVNHGPARATKMLQEALGLKADGIMGPITKAALQGARQETLTLKVQAARIRFFGRIISGNRTDADKDGMPDNAEFAAGWLDRVADMIEKEA